MDVLKLRTITATELQRKYREVIMLAKQTKRPLVVLCHNRPDAVFMDYATSERLEKERLDSGGLPW